SPGALAQESTPPAPSSSATDPGSPSPMAVVRGPRVAVPPNVMVSVDGAPANVEDGFVAIKGELGSVHRVLLRSGKRQASYDVVIRERGAVPPQLAFDASSAANRRAVNPPPPAAASRPTGAATSPPGKRGKSDLATDSFE